MMFPTCTEFQSNPSAKDVDIAMTMPGGGPFRLVSGHSLDLSPHYIIVLLLRLHPRASRTDTQRPPKNLCFPICTHADMYAR